jgi:hypothetical protein
MVSNIDGVEERRCDEGEKKRIEGGYGVQGCS